MSIRLLPAPLRPLQRSKRRQLPFSHRQGPPRNPNTRTHLPPHHLPPQSHPVAPPHVPLSTRRGNPLLIEGSFVPRAGISGSASPGSSASLSARASGLAPRWKPSVRTVSSHPTITSPNTTTRLTTCSPTSQYPTPSTPTPSHIHKITNKTRIIIMVDTHVHCLRRVTPLPISSLIPTRPYNKLQTGPDWPFSSWRPPVWE